MSPQSISSPVTPQGDYGDPWHRGFPTAEHPQAADQRAFESTLPPVPRSTSPQPSISSAGYSLDSLAMETVVERQNVPQLPKYIPPTVAEIVGPPPSLPTLPPDHVLQPLVNELRSWVAVCVESYEIRERQRRDVMASCIASAHQKAVDATRRMTRQMRDIAEELDRVRDRLAVADRDAAAWKQRALEFSGLTSVPLSTSGPAVHIPSPQTSAETAVPPHEGQHQKLQEEIDTLKSQVLSLFGCR